MKIIHNLKIVPALILILPALIHLSPIFAEDKYEPGEVAEKCAERDEPFFLEDGHNLTTYLTAKFAGIGDIGTYTVAFYSQYPDFDKTYSAASVAWRYALLFWKWQWRSEIMKVLHSLHGGKKDAVIARRKKLSKSIEYYLSKGDYWKAGLSIHALGDAYSHTKQEYGADNQKKPILGLLAMPYIFSIQTR